MYFLLNIFLRSDTFCLFQDMFCIFQPSQGKLARNTLLLGNESRCEACSPGKAVMLSTYSGLVSRHFFYPRKYGWYHPGPAQRFAKDHYRCHRHDRQVLFSEHHLRDLLDRSVAEERWPVPAIILLYVAPLRTRFPEVWLAPTTISSSRRS